MKSFIIKKNENDQRIDKFLKKALPKLSSDLIYKYIRLKKIKVNGKRTLPSYKLVLEDKIDVYLNDDIVANETKKNDFLLAKKQLEVIYEDKNIIIVNKPVNVTVQDDDSKNPDTLNNRLLLYLYQKKEWDYLVQTTFTPAFVHRLDRNTSGLIIAAKNVESSRILSEKIKNREIEKYYICKVHGIVEPKQGVLKDWWTKKEDNFVTVSKKPLNMNSKEIITEYKLLAHKNNVSLLQIHLITGRTHQIRAHMYFFNHPLLGERKYTNIAEKNDGEYQFLFSYKIIFNFKQNNGILEYLKNKELSLPIPKF